MMSVTLPNAQLELSAVMEFENQEWVKNTAQADKTKLTKKHVEPNAAFPFQDDFLVGTIHGKNMYAQPNEKEKRMGIKDAAEIIKITDSNSKSAVGNRVASGSTPSISGFIANATPTRANRTAPIVAEGSMIHPSTGTVGRVDGRLSSK